MKLEPVAFLAALTVFFATAVLAAAPELKPEDLPRVPPVEKSNYAKVFQLKSGFELQLAAAEPLTVDPIDLAFDEQGRLFTVEMIDYSERRHEQPHLGQVRLLVDTNGDGVFDRMTIYAEDLPWPTSVCCYDGGVFVAASPDILYFKDTNGDGKADIRKVVFTGFGAGKEDKLNMQALVNGLRWGMDNRIHGQTAGNGGMVKRADSPDAQALELRGRDFSFDPRKLDLLPENGGGQYGMSFDNHGRKYVCSNSRHLLAFMYDAHYGERNKFHNMPPAIVDIPVDGPAAEVYRTSPEEAWRVIRTKWRVTGVVPGLIEGGGRSSGYFTSATGITIYRGDAWPEGFLGDAFIADVGSNLLHRKKIRPRGVERIAERPDDEQKVEFLTATDLWFRPVQLANAPDGCLYLCDMYREVIEHPWSLPENIKKLLDLNSGNDRGRIYRIAPTGFKSPKPPQLGKAKTAQLVATLESKNGWHRETASRLLWHKQDKAAVPLLNKLLKNSKSPLARLHALHALAGQGALLEATLLTALNDPDGAVREHAIKLAEKFISNGALPAALWTRLQQLAGDSDILVRYQLAFTLGEVKSRERIAALATIARQDADSAWTRAAILSSLAEGAGDLFATLSGDGGFRGSKPGQEMLRQLIALVGAKKDPAELDSVVAFLKQMNDPALVFSMTRALGDGLQQARASLAMVGGEVTGILTQATKAAADDSVPEAARVPAVELLSHQPYALVSPILLPLLEQRQPQSIQLAALGTLAKFSDASVGGDLLKQWNSLTPRLRAEALPVLLARPERATELLRAIEAGTIRASVLDTTQTKLLTTYRDAAVRQLATKVLSAPPASTRQQVIDAFAPALTLKGDVAHGKKIYEERCISCHRSSGEGFALGPDMVTVKTTGKEKLLTNIVDPNREVRPEFVAYVIETKDDESYIGLVVNETSTSVTVRQAYGKETVVPRASIAKMRSQGQSVMPEGLEQNLTPQDLADLLDYVSKAAQ